MTKKERIKELEKRNLEIEETIRFLIKDREKHLHSWDNVTQDMQKIHQLFSVVQKNFEAQKRFNLKQNDFNEEFLALLDARK
jgi:hypothetical protein